MNTALSPVATRWHQGALRRTGTSRATHRGDGVVRSGDQTVKGPCITEWWNLLLLTNSLWPPFSCGLYDAFCQTLLAGTVSVNLAEPWVVTVCFVWVSMVGKGCSRPQTGSSGRVTCTGQLTQRTAVRDESRASIPCCGLVIPGAGQSLLVFVRD